MYHPTTKYCSFYVAYVLVPLFNYLITFNYFNKGDSQPDDEPSGVLGGLGNSDSDSESGNESPKVLGY